MLTPFDDYPIHQTSLPLAAAANGHPNHYDRYWFNGYTEDFYFAVALGIYPNRGVIDAAFSVVRGGVQRSVFASGRAPLDRTQTHIGPIQIEIVEPLRVNRIQVNAPEHGLVADLTYRARTPAYQEARQLQHSGAQLFMDVTRVTQLGSWSGSLRCNDEPVPFEGPVYGTKDRSWGIRKLGQPIPSAPATQAHQVFFLYAPLNFADECVHYMVFEDQHGTPWAQSGVVLPVIGDDDPISGDELGTRHVQIENQVRWAPGLRRSEGATLTLAEDGRGLEPIQLEPLITFRMKGVGYQHPTWRHGNWHDELVVGGEEAAVEELDTLAPENVHVQQVMRATWGDRQGLGTLEQLVFGPHEPSGFKEAFDGAPATE